MRGPTEPPAAEMREPPEPEALWDEMTRLCTLGTPVRALPYALVDKRLIQWVPGVPAPVGWGCPGPGTPPEPPLPLQAAAGARRAAAKLEATMAAQVAGG